MSAQGLRWASRSSFFSFARQVCAVVACLVVTSAIANVTLADKPAGSENWNGEKIGWLSYDAALKASKKNGKPVVIVFHAEWCPHCRTYRKAFYAPEIMSLSGAVNFAMVNIDEEPRLNSKYALDGGYIPRTMVVNAKGVVQTRLRNKARNSYQYFIEPGSPDALMTLLLRTLDAG